MASLAKHEVYSRSTRAGVRTAPESAQKTACCFVRHVKGEYYAHTSGAAHQDRWRIDALTASQTSARARARDSSRYGQVEVERGSAFHEESLLACVLALDVRCAQLRMPRAARARISRGGNSASNRTSIKAHCNAVQMGVRAHALSVGPALIWSTLIRRANPTNCDHRA